MVVVGLAVYVPDATAAPSGFPFVFTLAGVAVYDDPLEDDLDSVGVDGSVIVEASDVFVNFSLLIASCNSASLCSNA